MAGAPLPLDDAPAAAVGTIRIDTDTHAAPGAGVQVEALGEVRSKGKAAAVSVFAVAARPAA